VSCLGSYMPGYKSQGLLEILFSVNNRTNRKMQGPTSITVAHCHWPCFFMEILKSHISHLSKAQTLKKPREKSS
jgi:hypothetical protein